MFSPIYRFPTLHRQHSLLRQALIWSHTSSTDVVHRFLSTSAYIYVFFLILLFVLILSPQGRWQTEREKGDEGILVWDLAEGDCFERGKVVWPCVVREKVVEICGVLSSKGKNSEFAERRSEAYDGCLRSVELHGEAAGLGGGTQLRWQVNVETGWQNLFWKRKEKEI